MGKPEITRKNIILASIKLAKENGPSNEIGRAHV